MQQEFAKYTTAQHDVWGTLFERQMSILETHAASPYLEGVERLGLQADTLPDFRQVNARLKDCTGWQLEVVPGIVANKAFFELLAEKRFPATTWIRGADSLDYIEAPDIFHDVFGHVPLLTDPSYTAFLSGLAEIALEYIDDPYAILLLSRLYWFTIEFGLLEENEKLKLYGAGLLSSPGEALYAARHPAPLRLSFDVGRILYQHYLTHEFQPLYFVVESFSQLYEAIDEIDHALLLALLSARN